MADARRETPDELNFLSPLIFKFSVARLPLTTFFIQSVSLPGISMGDARQANPFRQIPIPGTHLDYDDLMINYKVDEKLKNYKEIHDWMRGLGFPERGSEYTAIANNKIDEGTGTWTGNGVYSDLSLVIMNSNRVPTSEIHFKDAYPVSISSLIFDTTGEDVMYLEAATTFRYRSFDVNLINE